MSARCGGCGQQAEPRVNVLGQQLDGLPEGWHGVTITGTPQRSYTLCERCTRRLTMRLGTS